MAEFTDRKGRKWSVRIDAAADQRLKARIPIDVRAIVERDYGALGTLLKDPIRLAEVLFAIVEEQAAAAGVTFDDFADGLGGDSLSDACNSFHEALADYMPRKVGTEMRRLRAAARRLYEQHVQETLSVIDSVDETQV